jgi:hypothetical protein
MAELPKIPRMPAPNTRIGFKTQGLLDAGSLVQVTYYVGGGPGESVVYIGKIAETGSVPAPFIALTGTFDVGRGQVRAPSDVVVFVGPGVIVEPYNPPER